MEKGSGCVVWWKLCSFGILGEVRVCNLGSIRFSLSDTTNHSGLQLNGKSTFKALIPVETFLEGFSHFNERV